MDDLNPHKTNHPAHEHVHEPPIQGGPNGAVENRSQGLRDV